MRACRVPLQPGIRAAIATLPVVFLLSSLVTGFGIGLAGFLFLGIALWHWHDSRQVLVQDWPALRPVVLAFAAYAAYALFLHLVRATGWNTVDAPLRMLLALAVVPVSRMAALAAAALAAWERWGAGFERAGGFLNPIVFGNLALLLALLALAALPDPRVRRHWWWVAAAVPAGANASMPGH